MNNYTDTFDVLTLTRDKNGDVTERKLETIEYISMNQFLKDISDCNDIEKYIRPHNNGISAASLGYTTDNILKIGMYRKIINSIPGDGDIVWKHSNVNKNANMMLKDILQDKKVLLHNTIEKYGYTINDTDIFYSTTYKPYTVLEKCAAL